MMGKISLLWVEDEPHFDVHVELLEDQYGFDVTWVRDPKDALGLIAGTVSYDIILLDFDFNSPMLDGADLAAAVRESKQQRHAKVALLSQKVVSDGEYQLQPDGMHCIGKPITVERLSSVLTALVNGGNVEQIVRKDR